MPLIEVADLHNEADFSLRPRALTALWQMEDRHFWHSARNAWIADLLGAYGEGPPKRVLDVGCGSGAVAQKLSNAGYQVTGVDTERRLVTKASERCKSAVFVLGDVAQLPASLQEPYDVVGFFDVLEHLDRPQDLLRAALRWAKPGALVIATVPALRALHSVIDDLSGHKRRYEPGELTRTFEQVGISQIAEHGIFRTSLALIRRQRARLDVAGPNLSPEEAETLMCANLKVPSAPVNGLMKLVCAVERSIGLKASRGKVGSSLVAIGRWNGSSAGPNGQ